MITEAAHDDRTFEFLNWGSVAEHGKLGKQTKRERWRIGGPMYEWQLLASVDDDGEGHVAECARGAEWEVACLSACAAWLIGRGPDNF